MMIFIPDCIADKGKNEILYLSNLFCFVIQVGVSSQSLHKCVCRICVCVCVCVELGNSFIKLYDSEIIGRKELRSLIKERSGSL